MIKIDAKNNSVEFHGNKPELFAELGCIIREFAKKGILNEKDFDLLKESAFLSDEEVDERALKSLNNIMDRLDKIFGNNKENITEELKEAMKKEWEK